MKKLITFRVWQKDIDCYEKFVEHKILEPFFKEGFEVKKMFTAPVSEKISSSGIYITLYLEKPLIQKEIDAATLQTEIEKTKLEIIDLETGEPTGKFI